MVLRLLSGEVVLCNSENRVHGGNENAYSELCSGSDSFVQDAVVN